MSSKTEFPVLLNVKIAETEDHCNVRADITGFRAKNVRVTSWQDSLVVEMRREDRPAQSYYLGEVDPEIYKRVIPLGFEINGDTIMTHYQSGKLSIGVAKRVNNASSTEAMRSYA